MVAALRNHSIVARAWIIVHAHDTIMFTALLLRWRTRYEAEQDDYNKIMAQSLADRLAEAYAELLHREMRTTTWGYAPDEVSDCRETWRMY